MNDRTSARAESAWLYLLAFLVLVTYSLARPGTESLFLGEHGSASLPRVWILVALTVVATVTLYNRLTARFDLLLVVVGSALASALVLAGCLTWVVLAPGTYGTYALYVWKDLYIVVLVEAFWSYANSRFPVAQAKRQYGLFCLFGQLGSLVGNLLSERVAASWGTIAAVSLVAPLLVGMAALVFVLRRGTLVPVHVERRSAKLWEGFALLMRHRYLATILAVVVLAQLVITLVDLEFNTIVEAAFPDVDVRTQMVARTYLVIDGLCVGLQLGTAWILGALGLARTMVGIPMVLGVAITGLMFGGSFLVAATAKVASKAFDYSVFRAAKEILYIPLGYAEKTLGKGVIDILGYRVAKAGVSFMLLALGPWRGSQLVLWLALGLVIVWAVFAQRATSAFAKASDL